MRRAVDRLVATIARIATRGLFRSVEVVGFEQLEPGVPRLIVANHFNGFVDPVVIAGALGRLPRFIAKATLWRTPGVPLLLGAAGVLPVHRTVDGGGDNQGTFREVVRELHRGETVAIFPEGTTHDNPHLSPVRTGAARLALDAAHDGVAAMEVVPIGVTFEDKVAVRTRVVVRAGAPIDPASTPYRDAGGEPVGSDDHEAVRRLTDQIHEGLAEVAPDFDDLLDAAEMRRAADVALRSRHLRPLAEVPLAEREALAKRLDRLPPDQRDPIATAAAEYDLLRSTINVRDEVLEPPVSIRVLVVRLVTTALAVFVLAPFAIVGLLANVVPATLVGLAGMAARAPVSKGTNRVLVGLVAFPATWATLAVLDVGDHGLRATVAGITAPLDPLLDLVGGRSGWAASVVLFLALPALGLLAVWLAERASVLYHSYRAVTTTVNRRGQIAGLRERRRALRQLVEDGVAGTDAGPA
ncbi:MAG: 1-acyl-sn-glycerol-3-phosphate acyltransferase [Acidimicrobiales bacterium]|nr:1-acyl-sn-glycerol-3-phosphate acyltransferase [Acidimicrobiales bacterium]